MRAPEEALHRVRDTTHFSYGEINNIHGIFPILLTR
jgi:hypothetical protein